MTTIETDLTGLNQFQSQLFGALLGQGKAGQGDAQKFIRAEAKGLAWEISKQMGPKTKEAGAKNISNDVKKVFFSIKKEIPSFTGSQAGNGDIRWLFGSKKTGYLVGVENEDLMLRASHSDLKEIFYSSNRHRGLKWQDISKSNRKSGSQRFIKINRTVITQDAMLKITSSAIKKVGQLRSTFAYTAYRLGKNNIPRWISKHWDNTVKCNGKAIFDDSQMNNPDQPSISFGSKANGVISNQQINTTIKNAIVSRAKSTEKKFMKILNGYAYDWNTGSVFRERQTDEIN